MPSRISGACTPCRSKKQKCSGHHPICTQCSNASIDCTWPEQRKRGPAKGYIEGLESRLHSAESLLLALLPLVSDNTIDRASTSLKHDEDEEMDRNGGRRSSPPLLNKKTGLDYWDSFPIDTRRNIRKWQYDCEVNSQPQPNQNDTDSTLQPPMRRYRSPTHSPGSTGSARRSSVSALAQQNNWMQTMQPYVTQHQMQTGATQQLLNLSHQRADHWMAQPNAKSMQLDPNIMHSRSMSVQTPNIYTGNVQQSLFW